MRPRGVVLVRLEEIEPTTGRRSISDGNASLLASRVPFHEERPTVVTPRSRCSVDAKVGYLEADRVERDLLGSGVDAANIERRRRADRLRLEVKSDVEREMLDRKGEASLEVMRARRKNERPAGRAVLEGPAASRVKPMLYGHGERQITGLLPLCEWLH